MATAAGHSRLASWTPFYEFDEERFFSSDGAPGQVRQRRQAGFAELAHRLTQRAPTTIDAMRRLEPAISDLQFTRAYRVPFPYRRHVMAHLRTESLATRSTGVCIEDLDGNLAYDVMGSYGVNLFGYDFYKECIEAGVARVRDLGPVLGPYHPAAPGERRRAVPTVGAR